MQAQALLEIVLRAGPASACHDERQGAETELRQWDEAFVAMLVGDSTQPGFEHATLRKAASTWRRWLAWQNEHAKNHNPFAPTAVMLNAFLAHVAKAGPTAASGVFGALEWLVRHTRLRHLPLHAAICGRFKTPAPGHNPVQQVPLDLLIGPWCHVCPVRVSFG